MRYRFNKIELDGLLLRPSAKFSADLTGMFDFDKDVELSETTDTGAYLGLAKTNYKKLTLNLMIKDRYDFSSLMKINGILAKQKMKLKFDLVGLGELQAEVVCQSKATSDETGRAMSIELLMLNPYFDYKSETVKLGIDNKDGLTFPTFLPFTFNQTSDRIASILTNYGNCTSYAEITLEGSIKNPKIINSTTNEMLYFDNLEMRAGDKLYINCDPRNREIVLNGFKRIDLRQGTWISLSEGDNSLILESDSIATENPNYSCKIKCVSRVI